MVETYHYAYDSFEGYMKNIKDPGTIKEIRMARGMYDWIRRDGQRKPGELVPAIPRRGKIELLYFIEGYDIPIKRDNSLDKGWKVIRKEKELEEMEFELENITIEGMKLQNSVVKWSAHIESACTYPLERKEQHFVTIKPYGTEQVKLTGMSYALLAGSRKATIIGYPKGHPWEKITFEAVLTQCGKETHHPTMEQTVTDMTFHVAHKETEVVEDLLPKVKMEMTMKDAEYLESLAVRAWEETYAGSDESLRATNMGELIKKAIAKAKAVNL